MPAIDILKTFIQMPPLAERERSCLNEKERLHEKYWEQ